MRVLLAVLLVGIVGCGGDDNSPGDVAASSSPVKAENAEAGAPKTKPLNSEDVSEAEPKDLAQERTETPTDVPSDSSSDEAVAALKKKLGVRIKQGEFKFETQRRVSERRPRGVFSAEYYGGTKPASRYICAM